MSDPLKFVEADGLRLAYVEEGPPEGPAVLLLHGWASSLRMWRSTQSALASRFRTFAIDLPGHGASSKPSWEWYTMATFSGSVREVCRRLGLSQVCLVGHSMGGTIAIELAAGNDPAVTGLVLVNPLVSGQFTPLIRPIRENWMRPVVGVTRRVWPVAARLLTRPPGAVRARFPEHVVRNQEDLGQTTADSALGSIRAVLAWDVRDRLESVHAPTLVVLGDSDRTVPPKEGMIAGDRIRGARVVRLPAGHHPPDETPDAFQAALADFLGPMYSPRV